MIDSADSATPAWRRVRNFLVARLTHFVGRKQAVRSVTSFMLGLSKRDTAKLLRLTSGQRSDQITREEADKIWNAEEKRALRGVMRSLEQPVWGASTLEPLISRRLRKEISSLRAALMRADDTQQINGCLLRLRNLHTEVKRGLEFYSAIDTL